ncbi:MAG TPA: MFS transporter [Candidatus Dormibacteraeota bacterium]|nr:MFS transporter [Candidatus Dormibacteraeota bacterium]
MITNNPHHARRWTILAILAIAQLMVVLDATIVNIALPSAQRDLHFANSERQWIVTAYALAFGSLLLLGGRISDLLGRKWTFIGGLAGFATASAVGGAAQSFGMLAASRALQGAFGALLAPAALSLMTTTFIDPGERNKAFGIWGAIAGSGAAIGLILGGVLTQTLSWRYSMYVNLVFATIAITGALMLLHNQAPAVRPKLDIPGVLTVSAGLFAIVYGFSHAETTSWSDHTTTGFLVTGALLLAVFALIEARSRSPLLPLRIVINRNRGASFLSIVIAGAAILSLLLFLTYYLQQARGYTPIKTGVAFLPMAASVMVSAMLATNKLRPRFGPRPLVVVGMLLGSGAMLYLTRLTVATSYATGILPALLMLGVGFGLVISTSINSATLGVQPSDAGVASATVSACQQIGGSLGTALLTTIAASASTSYIASAHAQPTTALLAHAAVHGDTTAFVWAAVMFAAGAVIAALLFERGTKALRVEAAAAPATAH